MRWRFEWLYRFGLALFVGIAFWACWSTAQETPATNKVSAEVAFQGGQTNALTSSLSNVAFLQHDIFGVPSWKYLAFLIYIVIAFYAAKLADLLTGVWLKRWTAKTETQYDDLILDLLRGPVKVVVFVIFLHVGLGVFDWPPRAALYLSRALTVVMACSITYVALKVVDVLLGLWRTKSASSEDKLFAEHLFPVLRKTLKVAIVLGAALITAENMQLEIKALLAGLSVGGLALGLAAQDTVANLFGAVSILLDKPFHVGDRIRVDSVDGTVETIGLRSTRVRSLDGHLVTVPNKIMGNAIITNITRRPIIRTELNIGLTYDTTPEMVKRATAILGEVYRAHPKTGELIISFNKFADSALNIFVVHVWKGADNPEYFAGMQELNLEIKRRFDAEKIEFAFPTQTVHVKQG